MTTSADFDVILTVEARSNALLEVITQQFNLTDSQVFREMRENVRHLRALLARKELEYLDLKRALVPSTDRSERAFLFDWSAMASGLYGVRVMHCLLPVLPKSSTRSVLAGDWASRWRPRAALRDSGIELTLPAGSSRFQELPDTLYVVYLNNLTSAMATKIDEAFASLPGYVGALDMTHGSIFKAMLSTMLVRDFVQHKGVVLLGHEDDRDENEDLSLKLYDFAMYGFKVRSVPLWMYGTYLSYKIERPVCDFDHWDAKFSLNAMTPAPTSLVDCQVVLEDAKLGYLMAEKAGSLKRVGLAGQSATDVAEQIRRKLAANYIYNLARSDSVETLKFNIVLEADGARSTCALEYRPEDRQLRAITLF
jgi:hypothetical protein